MKRNLPDLCLAVAIGATTLWLCLHPHAFGWIVTVFLAAILFAPYLAFPVWLVSEPPPATPPETPPLPSPQPTAPTPATPRDALTPFILGMAVGHWLTDSPDSK